MPLLSQEAVGSFSHSISSNDPFNPSLGAGGNIKRDQLRFNEQQNPISNSLNHSPSSARSLEAKNEHKAVEKHELCKNLWDWRYIWDEQIARDVFPWLRPRGGGFRDQLSFFISTLFVQKGWASTGDGQDKGAFS